MATFKNSLINRRGLLQLGTFAGFATALSPALGLGQEDASFSRGCRNMRQPRNAAEALLALTAGNQRWATFTQCHPNENAGRAGLW